MAELITSLIQMLVDEDRLIALDEYTFLLTALRQFSGPAKRIANLLVLQATPLLLKPFQIGCVTSSHSYAYRPTNLSVDRERERACACVRERKGRRADVLLHTIRSQIKK